VGTARQCDNLGERVGTAFPLLKCLRAPKMQNPVDSVSTFTYLGSIQSSDGYCRPDVLSNVVFGLYLEGTPATHSHQNMCLPRSRSVRPTLCLRDMDSHFSRCEVAGGIPSEMPTQNPENLMEAIRSQLGNICAH